MATNFGFSQISNPTPASINLWVRAITVTIAVFLAWSNSSDGLLGEHAQHIVNSISGLFLGLINGIAPLFGVTISEATVPKEDVTAIKETPKQQ